MEKPTIIINNTKGYTGGISYVKVSEDNSLPHVTYRASTNVHHSRTLNEERLKELLEKQVKQLHCPLIQIPKKDIKDYVLVASERAGRNIVADKFEQIDFTRNNIAVVLHYCYSEQQLLQPAKEVSEADILLILWTYLSPVSQSQSIRERLCLELFVDEQLWKVILKPEIHAELAHFQHLVEDFVRNKLPRRRLSFIRDGPSIELISLTSKREGYDEHRWHFPVDNMPTDAGGDSTSVGITTYSGVFTAKELDDIEHLIDKELLEAPKGRFLPETFQCNRRGKKPIRTKIFFGSRYLWGNGKATLRDPTAGIRADVDPVPDWLCELVEKRLIAVGLIARDWLNSFAINVYHDGSLGLAPHMDDTSRFEQPIFSLRLYSSSRLTFGAQAQGMTNPLFFIPMPRGCITVMEDGGYAANKLTHCVRPSDMSGKSASIVMRRFRVNLLRVARALQEEESKNVDEKK